MPVILVFSKQLGLINCEGSVLRQAPLRGGRRSPQGLCSLTGACRTCEEEVPVHAVMKWGVTYDNAGREVWLLPDRESFSAMALKSRTTFVLSSTSPHLASFILCPVRCQIPLCATKLLSWIIRSVHETMFLWPALVFLQVSVKDGGSAKAPLGLHRGSAQGLGSLRRGCNAGEEDGVEDKEGVHVLSV